jgi:hypothetical protein
VVYEAATKKRVESLPSAASVIATDEVIFDPAWLPLNASSAQPLLNAFAAVVKHLQAQQQQQQQQSTPAVAPAPAPTEVKAPEKKSPAKSDLDFSFLSFPPASKPATTAAASSSAAASSAASSASSSSGPTLSFLHARLIESTVRAFWTLAQHRPSAMALLQSEFGSLLTQLAKSPTPITMGDPASGLMEGGLIISFV